MKELRRPLFHFFCESVGLPPHREEEGGGGRRTRRRRRSIQEDEEVEVGPEPRGRGGSMKVNEDDMKIKVARTEEMRGIGG